MQGVVKKADATYVKRLAQIKTSSHSNITEYAANTFAFKDKASTRLPSQTRRLVTRRFGIDERRFELLKGTLHKDALRQITEPQRRHCQMFCTANAFNRAVDGLRNQASGV